MSADGDGGPKQRFELYIKASAIDKETKGSCPVCQHWFMITCLLGERQNDIDFKVYTVQADCPPKNFGVEQGWSKLFPVVMVLEGVDKKGQDLAGTKYDTFEELETFFESINREYPALKRHNAPNVGAMKVVEDVYTAFNKCLSTREPKRLLTQLRKINEFLEEESDSKFLVDDVLSFADCHLLPRLQHIRVAGKFYMKDAFDDIPKEFTAIWRYLAEAYKTEAFRSTVPADQDILFHYEKKLGSMQLRRGHPRPTLQNFTYTLDIPEDVALTLSQSTANTNGDVSEPLPPPTEQFSTVDISPQPDEDVQAVPDVTVQDEVQEEVPVQEEAPMQEEVEVPVQEEAPVQEEVQDQVSAGVQEQSQEAVQEQSNEESPEQVNETQEKSTEESQEPYNEEVQQQVSEPVEDQPAAASAAVDNEDNGAALQEAVVADEAVVVNAAAVADSAEDGIAAAEVSQGDDAAADENKADDGVVGDVNGTGESEETPGQVEVVGNGDGAEVSNGTAGDDSEGGKDSAQDEDAGLKIKNVQVDDAKQEEAVTDAGGM